MSERKNEYDNEHIKPYISLQKTKKTINSEYCLKLGVNNPWKNSPNVFIKTLQYRLFKYYKESKLASDPLIL